MAEEYTRLSLLVNGRNQLSPLVLENKTSESYDIRTLGAGNRDFSVLVELRHSHQTRHAAEGVRTRDAAKSNRPSESVRCKLIREMNTLLREDQVRATGTGQDRKLRWQTSAQGTAHLGPVLVSAGNSANAATVAALKSEKVHRHLFVIFDPVD